MDVVNLHEPARREELMGPETAQEEVMIAAEGPLYADGASMKSRSPDGMGRIVPVFVEACVFSASESKAEVLDMTSPHAPAEELLRLFRRCRFQKPGRLV